MRFNFNGKEVFIDDALARIADEAKEAVTKRDFDAIFLIDGMEGSGKSTLAATLACYLDPTFNLDRMCFEAKEFIEKVTTAQKFQCVVLDEAFAALNSRQALSRVNRAIIGMLSEIRAKNLFIIVILPSFFDLDKNIALWRSKILLHVYLKNGRRGQFSVFDYEKKKLLYMMGKKFYSYAKPRANFVARFNKDFPLDKEEYNKRKFAGMGKFQLEEKIHPSEIYLYRAMDYMAMVLGYSQSRIAKILSISRDLVAKYRQKGVKYEEKFFKRNESHS